MLKYVLPAACLALLLARPALASQTTAAASALLRRLSKRPWVAALIAATLPILARLCLLPWFPIPVPVIQDEFSYLLAGDIFANGRLSNPAHPLWQFFEAPHIVVHPAVFSKYPPGQGLFLALGQLLTDEPWAGVLLSSALLSAACFWMLAAVFPRRYALGATLLLASFLTVPNYWMNSYWGGNVAAIGGALQLGAFLRLWRRPSALHGAIFGLAWGILAISRPYEGAFLFALPLVLALLTRGLRRSTWAGLLPAAAFSLLLLGTYNQAVTGNPTKLPYSVYSEQYAWVPAFSFLPLAPKPAYRNQLMDSVMSYDLDRYNRARGPEKWSWLAKEWTAILDILHPRLLSIAWLAFLPLLARDPRTRWLLALLAIGIAGLSIETYHQAHYFAPFVPLLWLLTFRAIATLARQDRSRHALAITLLAAIAIDAAAATKRAMRPGTKPSIIGIRPHVERMLRDSLEEHLVFVRDLTPTGELHPSWAYNRANLDQSPVIWATDLGDAENQKLIALYPKRKVWLLPIEPPLTLHPYGPPRPFQKEIQLVR